MLCWWDCGCGFLVEIVGLLVLMASSKSMLVSVNVVSTLWLVDGGMSWLSCRFRTPWVDCRMDEFIISQLSVDAFGLGLQWTLLALIKFYLIKPLEQTYHPLSPAQYFPLP